MEVIILLVSSFVLYMMFFKTEPKEAIKPKKTKNSKDNKEWKTIEPFNKIPSGYKVYKRDVSLKGVPNYMDAFMRVFEEEKEITIVPEPNNKYDKNAIYLAFDGDKIGYIEKEVSKKMIKDMNPSITNQFSIKLYKLGYTKDKKAGFMRFDLLIKKEIKKK